MWLHQGGASTRGGGGQKSFNFGAKTFYSDLIVGGEDREGEATKAGGLRKPRIPSPWVDRVDKGGNIPIGKSHQTVFMLMWSAGNCLFCRIRDWVTRPSGPLGYPCAPKLQRDHRQGPKSARWRRSRASPMLNPSLTKPPTKPHRSPTRAPSKPNPGPIKAPSKPHSSPI